MNPINPIVIFLKSFHVTRPGFVSISLPYKQQNQCTTSHQPLLEGQCHFVCVSVRKVVPGRTSTPVPVKHCHQKTLPLQLSRRYGKSK